MNRDTFLQWCADGKFKDIEQILSEHCHDEMLWMVPFDHGFGAPTQSLLEQAIEVSLVHENRCWLPLLQCLSKHPEQMYAFVFGQLLYWDVSYQLKTVERNDPLTELLDMAFDLLDTDTVAHLKHSVERYCVAWGKWMLENMEHNRLRNRILHNITGGIEDEQHKI